MPELSPTIFAIVVVALVGVLIVVPRLRQRGQKHTAEELYIGARTENRTPVASAPPAATPLGAPRAPSPVQNGQNGQSAPAAEPTPPLKLPS